MSNAVSATAGLGSATFLVSTNTSTPAALDLGNPFVAMLCFFKNAAEKPEAHTWWTEKWQKKILS